MIFPKNNIVTNKSGKVLRFADANFGHLELAYWRRTVEHLADIPKREPTLGAEIRYARWLGIERSEIIREATKDELSKFLSGSPREADTFQQRAPSEAFFRWAVQLPLQYMDLRTLENCASVSSGVVDQRIRISRNFSAPNARGTRQEFVAPAELPHAIDEFCNVWNGNGNIEESPIPIWLFVALLNTHPFGDGNGRLARNLLNVSLARNGLLKGHPIPFGPLIYATQGNFELAMGRAAIMGNWEPILETFSFLIGFYVDHYR